MFFPAFEFARDDGVAGFVVEIGAAAAGWVEEFSKAGEDVEGAVVLGVGFEFVSFSGPGVLHTDT